jgi:glucan phosphoethanolaminetransferase (alkaline phosphatase superfamily)
MALNITPKRLKYAAISAATTIAISIPSGANAQTTGGGIFGKGETRATEIFKVEGNEAQGLEKIGPLIFGTIGLIFFIFVAVLVVRAMKEASTPGDTDWTPIIVGLVIFILGLVFISYASKALFG